ncbi:MAG: peptidoglycan DD-metalloendopeptidase family protein [Gammaproteobacteria bacterium]
MFTRTMRRKNLSFILLLFSLLVCSTVLASPISRLQEIVNQIKTLKSHLTETQKQQTAVQQQLKQAEISIGSITNAAQKTSKQLALEQRLLKALGSKQADYLEELATEKEHVMNEMRAAYLIGHDGYIKLIFNQEDPSNIDRMSVYYAYLLDARARALSNLRATLQKITENSNTIKAQELVLQNLYSHQEKERQDLKKMQGERNIALKSIKNNLQNQNTKLQQLLANKAALEKLIAEINARILAQKQKPIAQGSLTQLRGKLFTPTHGKLESFGAGESRLNGVLVAAKEGAEVHAIAGGRVVFADWLRGYGLLLIIDHGHGYMSLYGRNHSLYKKTGDSVASGETIATVGNTGGYEKTGLYFAMRYNGRPIDPTVWCKM